LKQKTKIWVSFIVINILCWLFFRFLYESGEKNKLPRILGHIFNFSWLLLVGLLGHLAWKNVTPTWIRDVWIYSYAGLTIVLVFFGLIDWMMGGFSLDLRELFGLTRAFFTTPMPFALCWFLYSIYGKKEVSAKRVL